MWLKTFMHGLRCYAGQNPLYLIHHVTSACNASCAHCLNLCVRNQRCQEDLSLLEIEEIAKKWQRLFVVNLAGGEPFLRDDIVEIAAAYVRFSGVRIIAIPSNGLLTKKIFLAVQEMLRRFPDVLYRFIFSVDALGPDHDKIRGVPGAFERVMQTISAIGGLKNRYKNFLLLTNTCFMPENFQDVKRALVFLANSSDVDDIGVTYLRGGHNAGKLGEHQNRYYREIVKYIMDVHGNRPCPGGFTRFIRNASDMARDRIAANLGSSKRNFPCYAAFKMVVMEHDGTVKACELLPSSLGSLREYNYDIAGILRLSLVSEERQRIQRRRCNCTWECAVRSGLLLNPAESIRIAYATLATAQINNCKSHS